MRGRVVQWKGKLGVPLTPGGMPSIMSPPLMPRCDHLVCGNEDVTAMWDPVIPDHHALEWDGSTTKVQLDCHCGHDPLIGTIRSQDFSVPVKSPQDQMGPGCC